MENAVGRRVLVPSSMWPEYACDDSGGEGWEGLVLRAEHVWSGSRWEASALVHFLHARDHTTGLPFANEILCLDALRAA